MDNDEEINYLISLINVLTKYTSSHITKTSLDLNMNQIFDETGNKSFALQVLTYSNGWITKILPIKYWHLFNCECIDNANNGNYSDFSYRLRCFINDIIKMKEFI